MCRIFKTNSIHGLLVAVAILMVCPKVESSEINLGGRQDLVLAKEVREQVLELSEKLLENAEDDFAEQVADLDNPFVFEQMDEIVAEAEEAVVERVINYDDASVLRVVKESFSKQVSGTLVRGSTSFLQLQGGNLVRPGDSFPVSIPQAEGKRFTVTVTEITGNSYTLKLGEAEQVVRLTGTAREGGGASFVD